MLKPATETFNISNDVVRGWNYTFRGEVDGTYIANAYTCDPDYFDYPEIMCL